MKNKKMIVLFVALCLLLGPFNASPARANWEAGSLALEDTAFSDIVFTSTVYSIAGQMDGKIIVGGGFSSVDGMPRHRVARLNADGSLDTSFDPGDGPSAQVDVLAVQSDGKVIIGGHFTDVSGVARNHTARLNTDGSLDTSFDPGDGANSDIVALALQPDGKVLIGGSFTSVDGVARNRIARLNADGSLDLTFDLGDGASGPVSALLTQPDGKVLVGGNFTEINGQPRSRIARLNPDGSLDASFAPQIDNGIASLALEPDGQILIGGYFTSVDGVSINRIARLNPDGSLDTSFDPGNGANYSVQAIGVQSDGAIVLGGAFTSMDGVGRDHLARLDSNGALDTSYATTGTDAYVYAVFIHPADRALIGGDFRYVEGRLRYHFAQLDVDGRFEDGFYAGNFNNEVYAIALQPDGKVLVGGMFLLYDDEERSRIARLNRDGSLDYSFEPVVNNPVYSLAVQSDGKILVGGWFTTVEGEDRMSLARLNTYGSLDASFDAGIGLDGTFTPYVRAIAVQADGKILIGGSFTAVGGVARPGLARLNADGTLDTSFAPSTWPDADIYALVLQPDGKAIVSGSYGQVLRFNTDGSQDVTFNTGQGGNGLARALSVQADGKVVVIGDFDWFNGFTCDGLVRLNADGSRDTGFDTAGILASSTIKTVVSLPDGKILLGGSSLSSSAVLYPGIARLNADGSLDSSFNPGSGATLMNHVIYTMVLQRDGRILAGGSFIEFNGVACKHIVRLNGGSAPEITSELPATSLQVGAAYSHTFVADGYPSAPLFAVTDGSLPPGLMLEPRTGELFGTPAAAGTYSFTVTAYNYVLPNDGQAITLDVGKGESTTSITSHTPDPSTAGELVTVTFTVAGGGVIPVGNVTISGGEVGCSATVAQGSCTLSFATIGVKNLTATYEGDANYNSSVSAAVAHTVHDGLYFISLPMLVRSP